MSSSKSVPFVFLCLLALSSCGEKERGEALPDESDRLYGESMMLVRSFADSIANATDSVAATAAFEHFNAGLDSVNFAVPPNTDLLLTEAENDTLYYEITRIRRLYEEKLRQLGAPEAPEQENPYEGNED